MNGEVERELVIGVDVDGRVCKIFERRKGRQFYYCSCSAILARGWRRRSSIQSGKEVWRYSSLNQL